MKRTARKYPPDAASGRDNILVIIGGIVVWALILAPIAWWLGAMLGR
jgi:hypothetical protein